MAGVKSYSIIIVPSDHSGTRQYRLSRSMLILLGVVAAGVVITMTIFAATYGAILVDARRVGELETENEALRMQVARVEDLSRELEALSGLRAQVTRLLGNDVLEGAPALETIGETADFEQRALVDIERLQEIFADASREPFAPRNWPTDGDVRREFIAETTAEETAHPGLSIGADEDAAVHAAGRGRVVETLYSEDSGHVVRIDHGYGFQTIYGNLDRVAVTRGQAVDQDQVIGEIDPESESVTGGNRGGTMLPGTLYFELRVDGTPVDPRRHLDPR